MANNLRISISRDKKTKKRSNGPFFTIISACGTAVRTTVTSAGPINLINTHYCVSYLSLSLSLQRVARPWTAVSDMWRPLPREKDVDSGRCINGLPLPWCQFKPQDFVYGRSKRYKRHLPGSIGKAFLLILDLSHGFKSPCTYDSFAFKFVLNSIQFITLPSFFSS